MFKIFHEIYDGLMWKMYWHSMQYLQSQQKDIQGLDRFDHDEVDQDQNYLGPIKIIVSSKRDKKQVLLALRYLHDLWEIDTDYIAVNHLVHMYQDHDDIIVKGSAIDA